jgi:hypothetical protein
MVMGEKRKEHRDPTRNFQKRLKIGVYKFDIESIWSQCCLDLPQSGGRQDVFSPWEELVCHMVHAIVPAGVSVLA